MVMCRWLVGLHSAQIGSDAWSLFTGLGQIYIEKNINKSYGLLGEGQHSQVKKNNLFLKKLINVRICYKFRERKEAKILESVSERNLKYSIKWFNQTIKINMGVPIRKCFNNCLIKLKVLRS